MREAAASAGARGEAQVMGPLVRARRRLVWLGARRGGGQPGRRTCSSETLWAFAFLLWAQSGVLQRLMLSHGTKAQTRRPSTLNRGFERDMQQTNAEVG